MRETGFAQLAGVTSTSTGIERTTTGGTGEGARADNVEAHNLPRRTADCARHHGEWIGYGAEERPAV